MTQYSCLGTVILYSLEQTTAMKKFVLLLWILAAILPNTFAATIPVNTTIGPLNPTDTKRAKQKPDPAAAYLQKHPKLQQALLQWTQKKWVQKWMAKADKKQRTKDIMGTVALVSGILLVVSLFTVPAAALLLVPAALVGGIIGISKNANRRSYWFALTGLILGGLYVVLLLLLLAAALAWSYGW